MKINYEAVPRYAIAPMAAAAYATEDGCRHTYASARYIIDQGIQGDIVECGVANGAQIGIMAKAFTHAGQRRTFHLFDSFQGIPLAGPKDVEQPGIGAIAHDANAPERDRLVTSGISAASVDRVKANLASWGWVGDFQYHEGWFQDTVPHFPTTPIALLRLDGDLYESTMVCLDYLYPNVVSGGLIVIDDYGLEGCKRAVQDFRRDNRIIPLMFVQSMGGGSKFATWVK